MLSQINLDEQIKHCKKLHEDFHLKISERNKALSEKKELIETWNVECEINKDKILNFKFGILSKIDCVSKQIEEIKSQISLESINIKEFKEELIDINLYEEDFTVSSIQAWLNKTKLIYESEFDKVEKKLKEINSEKFLLEKEIKSLKDSIEDIETKYSAFICKNKSLILKLKEININEEFNINEWKDFKEYYDLLEEKLNNYNMRIRIFNKYISQYESITKNTNTINEKENLTYIKNKYDDYKLQMFDADNVNFKSILSKYDKVNIILDKIKYKSEILDYIDNELCDTEYNVKYAKLTRNIHIIKQNLNKYIEFEQKIKNTLSMAKKYIEGNIEKVLGSQSMNKIYSIIEPNKEFKKLKIEVEFNDNDIPGLYIKGNDEENHNDILPEYFFSSAQLNTVALSMFLGGALSLDLKVKTIFIDDPVGHFDDINVLAFIDLLRNIVTNGEWQVIISTHDESFYNILQNKISSDYYNSKFIEFSSSGKLKK